MPVEQEETPISEAEEALPQRRWSRRRRILAGLGIVLLAILLYGWFDRERIADDLISDQLEKSGVTARYEIEQIGPRRQVLRNLSFGDPDRPDLTIEELVVETGTRWGIPRIGRVRVVKPRLHGTYRDGKLSFGSLDPLIFAESEEPFRLPDFGLTLVDGRGLLESDFGPVGLKAEGDGALRDGFNGVIAVAAPSLDFTVCKAEGATFFGKISVEGEKPRISGPARVANLVCPGQALALRKTAINLDAVLDQPLDGGEIKAALSAGPARMGESRSSGASGELKLTYRKDAVTARYDIALRGIVTPQLNMQSIRSSGHVRGQGDLSRIDVEGSLDGAALAPGKELKAALAGLAEAGNGTFLEPVARQVSGALMRESRGSKLSGDFIVRRSDDGISVVVPRIMVRGGSEAPLLTVSRLQFGANGDQISKLSGNFATSGKGLPEISARMERPAGGRLEVRFKMPAYNAGESRLSVPDLAIAEQGGGEFRLIGNLSLSGDLPGGRIENLQVPMEGGWSQRDGLSLWRHCMRLRFDRVEMAEASLDRGQIELCPQRGSAIVRNDGRGVRLAANGAPLELHGKMGESPLRIATGPVTVAWPGQLSARQVDVSFGPDESESIFRFGAIYADLNVGVLGSFEDGEVLLGAVPLDVVQASGNWSFADATLAIEDGAFRLEDRENVDRFEPLTARDARLTLSGNVIDGEAILREPASGRAVMRTVLRHDLGSGIGNADLFVDGIDFNEKVQPDTLSHLALGVIANARGSVRGKGRIDWNPEDLTSTGAFTTDKFDFAAAFGPVEGVSGTVTFTDLLGIVTAPDQKLKIASINPGIEVTDGVLTFEMNPGYEVEIAGATWPFLDGTLRLLPVHMLIGSDDPLRYTLEVEGLNAARFIEQMELGNLAATGSFDGALPLVFDKDGGHIEGGILRSRAPGGNVSYVGELTYKDLSTLANFAFDSLKSLDYGEMAILLDGDLEGELVTQVKFRSIRQGEKASRNFVTKQIARLPIQFNVNLRAPFYQLITSYRSFYETEYVRDPRTLGLMDASGKAVSRPEGDLRNLVPNQQAIQPSESGESP